MLVFMIRGAAEADMGDGKAQEARLKGKKVGKLQGGAEVERRDV
jgi:hypothetical protein